jgi:hypothetical protein
VSPNSPGLEYKGGRATAHLFAPERVMIESEMNVCWPSELATCLVHEASYAQLTLLSRIDGDALRAQKQSAPDVLDGSRAGLFHTSKSLLN